MRCRSLAIAIVCFGLAGPTHAAGIDWLRPKADYQADTLMETTEGRMQGLVYASGMKERREFTMGGRRHVMIVRRDKGVSWVLMPEQRMYLEQAIGKDGMPQDRFEGGRLEREALGKEQVNGAAATKYRVHGATPEGDPFEGTMWMTKDEIPVRVVTGPAHGSVRMELSNLKVGKIDASRFEVPSGFTRFALPGPAQQDLDALRRQYGR